MFDDNNESSLEASFFAVAINLASPVLLSLCLASLRLACTELMRPDNRVRGTVSAVELTSIKLFVSSLVGLLLACILEGGVEDKVTGRMEHSWWVAFIELSASTRSWVIGGALLISVFQVNCTFLTFLTSTVALGLVGQVKIIPQWVFALMLGVGSGGIPTSGTSITGATLIMSSAAAYAISNLVSTKTTSSSSKDKNKNYGRTAKTNEKTYLLAFRTGTFENSVSCPNLSSIKSKKCSAAGVPQCR